MSVLGRLLVGQAQGMHGRLVDYTARLVARPGQLADFVSYVQEVWPHLDPLSARRQAITADLGYMERLHATYAA